MKIITLFLVSSFFLLASANASPSETSHFQMYFKGENAENYKNQALQRQSTEYGADKAHIMHDSYYNYSTTPNALGESMSFNIECQQRVLNYLTQSPENLAPTCSFSYFTRTQDDGPMQMFTNIYMTAPIAAKMIQNLKWQKLNESGALYFGCHDNMESGCPSIHYYPADGSLTEAEVEIIFYK